MFARLLLIGLLLVGLSAWAGDKEEVAAAGEQWAALFVDDNPDSILAILFKDEWQIQFQRKLSCFPGMQPRSNFFA
jgi:hypothetical protein